MNRTIKLVSVLLVTVLMFVFVAPICFSKAEATDVVYVRDGGNGDGTTYNNASGDFKEAVRTLSKNGGTIVICGKYTVNNLITLSNRTGTSNGENTIKVTSVYNGNNYRQSDGAVLCIGDDSMSANIVLAGNFVFENLDITTSGGDKPRAVICSGYNVVFGDGIVCKKQGNAPYVSIVGMSLSEYIDRDSSITIKSGTYNYVCAGNRDGLHTGSTELIIDGGYFEGDVSATGFGDNGEWASERAELVINNGTFFGNVGAVSGVTDEFTMTINGGIFRKDIVAMGKINIIDINGGNLQNVGVVKIADYVPEQPNTDEETKDGQSDSAEPDGATEESKENQATPDDESTDAEQNEEPIPVRFSTVNINKYDGDVKKLISKIQGEGVVINQNTEGGVDSVPNGEYAETETVGDETKQPDDYETDPMGEKQTDRNIVGKAGLTKKLKVIILISLTCVLLLSCVAFLYRYSKRKMN